MDITGKYIKMCQMATEIQKNWKPQEWDWIKYYDTYFKKEQIWHVLPYEIADSGFYGAYIEGEGIGSDKYNSQLVWLPQQDQLQEMVFNRYDGYRWLIIDFAEWVGEYKDKTSLSMEQLWLFFVMGKRFNKQWDGKDWKDNACS
jgi:hypothetical protein